MQTKHNTPFHSPWLFAGIACLLAGRHYEYAPLLLLSPVFLIRFVRSQTVLAGMLPVCIGAVATVLLLFKNIAPHLFHSTAAFITVMTVSTLISMLPLLMDRLLAHRLGKVTGTFIYPICKTIIEYVGSVNSPFGMWGSQASLFAGWLPLSQLVAVTGIWGVSFLLSWTAIIINLFWENGWRKSYRAGIVYLVTVVAVISIGTIRLYNSPASPTVKAAAVIANDAYFEPLKNTVYHSLESGTYPAIAATTRHYIDSLAEQNNQFLLAQSELAASAGAKVIFWAEGNGMVTKENEETLIAKGSRLAKQYRIYLGMAVEVYNGRKDYPVENKIILLQPDGSIAWQYYKAHPLGNEQELMQKGDGEIRILHTPYGNIAAVICFDTDFITYARKAGKAGADILFAPSNDWQEIATLRGAITKYRALENGVTLVRPTSHGVSEIVNSKGETILANNYFTHPQHLLMADVPVKGNNTIYAAAGDYFPILCIVVLTGLLISLRIQRKRSYRTASKKVITIVSLLLLFISNNAAAQNTADVKPADSTKAKTVLLPAISYAPETSLALGVSGMHLFAAPAHGQPSQLSATLLYTFHNQYIAELSTYSFLKRDYIIKANACFEKYPENYYGTGNNTADSNKLLVNYSVVKWDGALLKKVYPGLYIGAKTYYRQYFHIQTNEEKLAAIGAGSSTAGGRTAGLGVEALYDTRDNNVTTTKGWYAELSAVWNSKYLGSQFTYQSINMDMRKFIPLHSSTVLALQAVAQIQNGNVPFLQQACLGGNSIMRGIYTGRYRGNDLLAAQAELRQQINKKLGVVFFAGYGEVAHSLQQFDFSGIHQSLGVGLRRRMSKTEKINLRIDAGFANGKCNAYIMIAEAF